MLGCLCAECGACGLVVWRRVWLFVARAASKEERRWVVSCEWPDRSAAEVCPHEGGAHNECSGIRARNGWMGLISGDGSAARVVVVVWRRVGLFVARAAS
jgi:coenzyme F420-reducing hydrogenase beta subunit